MKKKMIILPLLVILTNIHAQDCDAVLKASKFKFSSKQEVAQYIHQQMQSLSAKTKSNSMGFAANIVLPTKAGPIPLGLKFDSNKSSTEYEQILNEFENETQQSIQIDQEMDFIPANQIDAWSKCIEQTSNSMYAMFYPGKASTQRQLVLTLYLTSKYKNIAIPNGIITSFIYTDETGEIVSDSTLLYKSLKGGETFTKIFKVNPSIDFYASVTFEAYEQPIEYVLKKQIINPPTTYIKNYEHGPIAMGGVPHRGKRHLLIKGFEPNKKVLVVVEYCVEKKCDLVFGGGDQESAIVRFKVDANGKSIDCPMKDYRFTTGAQPLPTCGCVYSVDDVMTSSTGNILLKFENGDSICHRYNDMGVNLTVQKIDITSID